MKILIADDHALFREGMKHLLRSSLQRAEIVMAQNHMEVTTALRPPPSLVLLDLSMPGMQGVLGVDRICGLAGETPVIVVSANETAHVIRACMERGAAAYVPKSADGNTMLRVVREVLNGGSYFPRRALAPAAGEPFDRLSKKKIRLLALLAEGHSNREIARRLHLSEGTVKQYVSAILCELDVPNRAQAGIRARAMLGMEEH